MAAAADPTSEDALLGGRLVLRQPLRGHRFGHDAVLLAAATPARTGEHAIDLGAGVGAAGLALARRVEGLAITLIELDPNLAALARENAARNALANRVRAVCLDVAARLLRPQGALTLIWRADGLAEVLAALASGYGAIAIMPVYPKPGAAAIRVLVSAAKGSNAPLTLLPGLFLADSDNKPSAQAEAVLRDGVALVLRAG